MARSLQSCTMMLILTTTLTSKLVWITPCNQRRIGSFDGNIPSMLASSALNGMLNGNTTLFGNYSTATKPLAFFLHQNRALKADQDKHHNKRNRQKTTLTSTERFTILPAKQSTSKAPAPKRSPKYQDDMPSIRLYFWRKWKQGVKQRMKRQERRIDDRYSNGWHK